jgi:hypothetical protein
LVLLEFGLLQDVLVLLAQFGLLGEALSLALLDLHADAHLEGLGLVLLLCLQLVEVDFALLVVGESVLLQLLLLEFVGLELDFVGLHVVLLLAQLLLDPAQLQQLGTLVELPLDVELTLCLSLDRRIGTICFSCFWASSPSMRSISELNSLICFCHSRLKRFISARWAYSSYLSSPSCLILIPSISRSSSCSRSALTLRLNPSASTYLPLASLSFWRAMVYSLS